MTMNKIRLFDVVPSPSGLNDIGYSFEVDGQEVSGVLMSREQLYRYLTNKFGERLFLTYADGLSAQKIDFINQLADFISARQHGINRSMRAWLDDYNPLHNFDRHEEVTTTNTGGHDTTETYNNVKDAFTYNNEKDTLTYRDEKNAFNYHDETDTFSYAPEGEKSTTTHDNDKSETTHTPTNYGTENSSVAFNSDTFNPLNKSVEVGTYKDSTVKSGSDSTTTTGGHSNKLSGGHDTTLTGGHDSTRTGGHDSTKSGSVTSSFLYKEGGEKSSVESWLRGNIGTTKSTDMVFEELDLRKTMIGRELVADFVMDTTIF